jgi:hypothetical protein
VENFIIGGGAESDLVDGLSGVVIADVGIMEKIHLSRCSFISTVAVK